MGYQLFLAEFNNISKMPDLFLPLCLMEGRRLSLCLFIKHEADAAFRVAQCDETESYIYSFVSDINILLCFKAHKRSN